MIEYIEGFQISTEDTKKNLDQTSTQVQNEKIEIFQQAEDLEETSKNKKNLFALSNFFKIIKEKIPEISATRISIEIELNNIEKQIHETKEYLNLKANEKTI